jgi:hypothetical protein
MQGAIRHKGHYSLCTPSEVLPDSVLSSSSYETAITSFHSYLPVLHFSTEEVWSAPPHRCMVLDYPVSSFRSTGSCSTRLIRQLLHNAECVKGQRVSRAPREVNILSSLSLRMASHLHDYKCNPNSNIQNRTPNPTRKKRQHKV